jgi:fructokinase
MTDVVALGELLIDFVSTESAVSLADAPAFKKAPGGAPANVAVALARLGQAAAFLGKVGDDDFGHFLAGVLARNGVDVSGLRFSHEARTMLAFVSLLAGGEREFMFYRHPSADMLYTPDEVDADLIRGARIFHCGSITLIDEPAGSATRHALQIAQDAGLLISYDPNLRLSLWPDSDQARAGILSVWEQAHVIKVSGEELHFISQEPQERAAVESLWHDALRLLVITDGPLGCRYITRSTSGRVGGFAVDTVDTTGAGDGFVAGLLAQILEDESILEDSARLEPALRFANAVGALTTTQRGAIPSLPTAESVRTLLSVE